MFKIDFTRHPEENEFKDFDILEIKEKEIKTTDNDNYNLLIEGDNINSLQYLQNEYKNKVDVIYIDPPYNTGNEFIYNDKFSQKEDKHSKWLSMMEKRLKLAHQLLSDDGVIFISIDDNELYQLKLLCDEIFGEKNFRNNFAIKRRMKNLNKQFISNGLHSFNVGFEYILSYSKTSSFKFEPFYEISTNENGKWNTFWNNADRKTMRYEILNFKPLTGQWRWKYEKAIKAINNYLLYESNYKETMTLEEYWEETNKELDFIKRDYNSNSKGGGVSYWIPPNVKNLKNTNWTDIEVSQIQNNMNLEFNNPKNINLIKKIINLSPNKNAIVLDFFAGSGTTGHAVMELNKEDCGNRQFILCTNNENNICEEVTYQRLNKVINGYTTPKGKEIEGFKNNLKYLKIEYK